MGFLGSIFLGLRDLLPHLGRARLQPCRNHRNVHAASAAEDNFFLLSLSFSPTRLVIPSTVREASNPSSADTRPRCLSMTLALTRSCIFFDAFHKPCGRGSLDPQAQVRLPWFSAVCNRAFRKTSSGLFVFVGTAFCGGPFCQLGSCRVPHPRFLRVGLGFSLFSQTLTKEEEGTAFSRAVNASKMMPLVASMWPRVFRPASTSSSPLVFCRMQPCLP